MTIFKFDPKAPVLLVNTEVIGPKGGHFVRMILDTGASYTMLHPDRRSSRPEFLKTLLPPH